MRNPAQRLRERVDTKAVDIEFGDRILICTDQDLADSCPIRDEFFECIEVAASFAAPALPAKKVVAVQFPWPDCSVAGKVFRGLTEIG